VTVLVLNAGSSSLKDALIDAAEDRVVEQGTARWTRTQARGHHEAAARDAVAGLSSAPDAIGHRVVHGGARFTAPTQIDASTLDEIRALSELAPLHNPSGRRRHRSGSATLPGV
jgi:acetate kinase